MTLPDEHYMGLALAEARKAATRAEVPIGAVLVHRESGEIITGSNNTIAKSDPTAHAEIEVIRQACAKTSSQRIPEYDLYVTLEPCAMCAAAISFARIRRLIIGAVDPKGGGVLHGGKLYDQPTCHHKPELVQLPIDECGQILKYFFQSRRDK